MKVLIAGATGKLGSDVLRVLADSEHEAFALCRSVSRIPADIDKSKYEPVEADVTDIASLKGVCDGMDVVISTVGLTKASKEYNNYDIDYYGNLNLLNEAKNARVKHFVYISVINADFKEGEKVAMVDSKHKFELELQKSGIDYVIHRPTGFFYDIAKVYRPMVEKGEVSLLKVRPEPKCNVVDTYDFAEFIVKTMTDKDRMYHVGGKETYTYREIGEMFFAAANKPVNIKYSPVWAMSMLAKLPKIKKEGKSASILFSRFCLSNDCLGDTIVGEKSFKAYIENSAGKE